MVLQRGNCSLILNNTISSWFGDRLLKSFPLSSLVFLIDVSCIQLQALAILYLYLPFTIIFANYRVITALILCKIVGTLRKRKFWDTWNAWCFQWPLTLWMPVNDCLTFSVISDHMGELWVLQTSDLSAIFWAHSDLSVTFDPERPFVLLRWSVTQDGIRNLGWPLIPEWLLLCFLLRSC